MCFNKKNKRYESYLVMIHHNDTRSSIKIVHCCCELDYTNMLISNKDFARISSKNVNIFLLPTFPSTYLKPVCFIDSKGIEYFDGV